MAKTATSNTAAINTILTNYANLRQQLGDLEKKLSDSETAVSSERIAAGRKRPNSDDLKKLQVIYDSQDKVETAYHDMVWDELVTLDKSDAVKQIAAQFNEANQKIKDALDSLGKDEDFLNVVAQVTDLLTKIGESLITLGLVR